MRMTSLLAPAAAAAVVAATLASSVQAAIALSAPPGLANGDKFRFLFVTRTTTSAASSFPHHYDAFVIDDADGATYNGVAINWKAVVSAGSTVTARVNVGGFGSSAGVYLADGTKIAHNMGSNSGGLWSGSLLAAPNIQIDSTALESGIQRVWTGSNSYGEQRFAAGAMATLGQTYCGIGDANRSTSDWLYYSVGSNTDQYRLYGLSQEFTYVAVPAPSALALLGAAGLVGGRRRRG